MDIEEMEKKRLRAEGVVNKNWFAAEKYKEEISKITLKDPPYNERDILLLRLGAVAFIQKVTLSDLENMIQDKINEAPEA